MDIDPIVLPTFIIGVIIFSGIAVKKKFDSRRRKRNRVQDQVQ